MSGPVANNIFKASGVIAAAAGGLNWDSTILTALTNLTVTVQNVGGANYYYINGVRQQTLNLLEGFTYKFDQSDSSNSNHPFRFSTTSNGTHAGGSEYTTGVTTSGTPGNAGAYTQIVVALDAPTLYYYCTNHNYMGGTANTVSETVEANRGYWIDTTSTTCTITLPSSPSKGDQIILVDYARTWGTNKIIINSNGSNYQGQDDTYVVEYSTNGEVVNIVYSDGTKGWIPQDDDEVADAPVAPPTQRAIFGYGTGRTNITNLVASNGVVGTNVTGVGTERQSLAAASYGGDKAIFGYGAAQSSNVSVTNLVNNNGVVASDTTGVGSARSTLQAVSYGLDKAMFSYGAIPGVGADYDGKTNLVTNQGVVGSDISQVGTERGYLASTGYGSTGQAIFAFGNINGGGRTAISNLVNNQGVIQADTSAVGTARAYVSGATYGGDKAIFCFGQNASEASINTRSLVNNLGVIAADATGAGTARYEGEASNYGGDKAIYAYGAGFTNISNLISNSGVVGSDVTGVGTARAYLAAAGYSTSA